MIDHHSFQESIQLTYIRNEYSTLFIGRFQQRVAIQQMHTLFIKLNF